MTKNWFTTRDITRLTGLTPYMVDYLCRAEIVVPARMGSRGRGRGKARRFSFSDLVALRTYARLLQQGVSVKRLRSAHKTWTRHFKTTDAPVPAARFLITNGRDVYLKQPDEALAELTKGGQFAFSFVVDLHEISREIDEVASDDPLLTELIRNAKTA